jgi:hypothetical protein
LFIMSKTHFPYSIDLCPLVFVKKNWKYIPYKHVHSVDINFPHNFYMLEAKKMFFSGDILSCVQWNIMQMAPDLQTFEL